MKATSKDRDRSPKPETDASSAAALPEDASETEVESSDQDPASQEEFVDDSAAEDGDEGEGEDEDEPAGEGEADAASPPEPTLWQFLRDTYFVFDRRTLGFARIMLGFLLVMDLLRRTWTWEDMYSNIGVLPNHVNLWRPQAWGAFTLLNAFSTPAELWALWGIIFATFFCVLIGFKTRIAQILTVVFVTSMDGRVLLIENGGYVVYNLLALWTCFLPMGDRFSVDAMLASMKARRERSAADLNDRSGLIEEKKLSPHQTVLGLILLIQLSAIYFFNVIHKTGPAWKDGTAVHYVLYVDRMVTPGVALIRDYIPWWIIIVLTKFTLACEASIPVCLLSPLGRTWARRLAIVLINALHIGFGTVFVLGPFAWACCVFSTLLFTTDDWEIAIRTMKRTHRARTVVYDPGSGFSFWLCRILARLDRYTLLTFRSEPGARFFVENPATGQALYRSAALADILAALPLGPAVAWIFRLPGIRHAVDAILGAFASQNLSRFFGLRPPAPVLAAGRAAFASEGLSSGDSIAVWPAPSPVRRAGRRFLVVLRELAILAMFAGAINQALTELWVFNRRFRVPHPEPLRILSHKLRFLQGWFMFSPNPVMDDGTIVVDATTIDGRKIDPLTGRPPSFELLTVKSLGYNQIWCDYINRMHLPANSAYRDAMKEYMYRLPQRTGRPEDAIVSGDVYWIQDLNPRWRQTKSFKFEKQKLFSFVNPAAHAQAQAPHPP